MSGLYGRYHGRILRLAIRATSDCAWEVQLGEILSEFDDDCCDLSASDSRLLRHELASFSDPSKRAVLVIALKHFDAAER